MFAQFTPALRMIVVMSALTGVIYPLVVTGIAKVAFPQTANGSLIEADGKTLGSDLIGQPFDDPKYFWSRPSATSPQPYNGMASSGSNQGPRNPALADAVKDRIKALRDADPGNTGPVPSISSPLGQRLDPHISVAAAEHQLAGSKARGLPASKCAVSLSKTPKAAHWGC
jgi:K+-transporting ATPase ATPase C chain